ncbi:MAG: hypothetical protein WD872_06310 [Pirellulaceae bacterium]
MKFRNLILAALASLLPAESARAIDWLTAPSYYTHDSVTAERVAQHSPIGPFYYYPRPDYLQSGYRHFRSTIQAGGSADNLHIVEEWGRPVRPYEEWRFPYRPYSVPYSQWGPPFGGLGPGGTFAPGGFGPGGFGPGAYAPQGGGNGYGHGGQHQPPANYAQPWLDGYYPQYNQQDRSRYYEPYTAPAP